MNFLGLENTKTRKQQVTPKTKVLQTKTETISKSSFFLEKNNDCDKKSINVCIYLTTWHNTLKSQFDHWKSSL